MKNSKRLVLLLLALVLLLGISGCDTTRASNLMDGMTPVAVSGKSADDAFIQSMADFSVDLFKRSISGDENSLISPLSVALALGMTANGADVETLAQFETLFGGISVEELNDYMYSYVKSLPSSKKSVLNLANSIWFRDNNDMLRVEDAFLQKNADYYGAAAFMAAFDSVTVQQINNWVNTNTDGMIKEVLNEIDDLSMLYLINAVMFDAEWQRVYNKGNIQNGDFTDFIGTVKSTKFMHSNEHLYLDDGMATGFIKPYAKVSDSNAGYSFAVLLPNEGVLIDDYIASLTGSGLINTMNSATDEVVNAALPKFKYEYDVLMNEALKSLGIPDAFDIEKADFSKMGRSEIGNLYIGKVLHKTFISVDELGTKAGAVTMVAATGAGIAPSEPKTVRLDRPFVYAVIDNATMLPIFIGTVLTVGQ